MERLSIQIGEEYLDLLPGTKLQLEEQNPFLQFGNDVIGPYSLPFDVPHTDTNIRLLQLSSYLAASKINVSLAAIVWENGIQHSVGTIKIEQVTGDLNNLKAGSTSLFYLTGSSTFYDKLGAKKLSDLDFGGDRTFSAIYNVWSGYEEGAADSFGQFLTTMMTSDYTNADFAFFPVLDDNIVSDDGVDNAGMMNNVVSISGQPRMSLWAYNGSGPNPIVPFPYLVYVIKKIFENSGWSVEGDIFNDPDFKKICLLSFRDIYWCSGSHHDTDHSNVYLNSKSPTTFNLKNYMPSVTIGQFLIALKDRFGWWYDFDLNSQVCVIRYLKDIVSASPEDITAIVETGYLNKIDIAGKIYSLTQTVDSSDTAAASADFESLTYIGEFAGAPTLPATADNVGKYYLKLKENCFYICRPTTADINVYAWERYSDNIFDYLPTDNTDTIVTVATTVAQENATLSNQHYHAAVPVLQGIFPRCDAPVIWTTKCAGLNTWPMRLIFYHGLQNDLNGLKYPYASNHPVDNFGNKIGNWSLSYKSKDIVTGEENGLYDLYWKSFLSILKQNETITIKARFPFSQKSSMNFGDSKVIMHTRYFVKTKRSVIPYDGSLEIDLIRV